MDRVLPPIEILDHENDAQSVATVLDAGARLQSQPVALAARRMSPTIDSAQRQSAALHFADGSAPRTAATP